MSVFDMEFAELLKKRISSGYSVVVIGTPPDADIAGHWCSAYVTAKPITIRIKEKLSEKRLKLFHAVEWAEARKSFILFSEFTRSEIFEYSTTDSPTEESVSECCLMDLHRFICEGDLYVFDWDQTLSDFASEILTPIEERLFEAIEDAGLKFQTQIQFDPYVVDFLIEKDGRRVVVEADGFAYHTPSVDQKRDTAIKVNHGLDTLRFGGSKIYKYTDQCIEEIFQYLNEAKKNKIRFIFEDQDELDESQLKAIQHDRGPARVVAPAGSGKTKVLINHVISLVNAGVEPRGILCLAFNRDAATQLEDRLTVLGIRVRRPTSRSKDGVTVCTFNSFGLSILSQQGVGAKAIDGRELENLARKTLDLSEIQLPALRGSDHWTALLESFSSIKRGLRPATEINCSFDARNNEVIEYPAAPLLDKFSELSADLNRVTYDDQIYLSLKFLLSDPLERHSVQQMFSHLVVDEYQDLNPAQISLVRVLAANNFEVFAVGDDDQLIYSWRQVSEDNIIRFDEIFNGMSDYPLGINYRSSKNIVRASQRLISRNVNRVKKHIEPYSLNSEGSFEIFGGKSLREQLDYLANYIKEKTTNSSTKYSNFTVLTRYRISQILVAHKLDSLGIPRSQISGVRLYSLPVAQRLLAYLEAAKDPNGFSGENFGKIINQPNRFIPNDLVETFQKQDNPKVFFKQILKAFKTETEYKEKIKSWRKKCAEIEKINQNEDDKNIEQPLEPKAPASLKLAQDFATLKEGWHRKNLIEFFKTINELAKDYANKSPSELIQTIINKADFRVKEDDKSLTDKVGEDVIVDILREDSKAFFAADDFITHFRENTSVELGEADKIRSQDNHHKNSDHVRLLTIHGAKGREWETVIMFDCAEESKIASGQESNRIEGANEEERRVFYVGMTRGRTHLLCTYRKETPSQYLKEAVVLPRFLRERDPQGAATNFVNMTKDKLTDLNNLISDLEQKQGSLGKLGERILNVEEKIAANDAELTRLIKAPTISTLAKLFKSGLSESERTRQMEILQGQRRSLEKDKLNIEQQQQERLAINYTKEIAENRELLQKQENNLQVITKMREQMKELF